MAINRLSKFSRSWAKLQKAWEAQESLRDRRLTLEIRGSMVVYFKDSPANTSMTGTNARLIRHSNIKELQEMLDDDEFTGYLVSQQVEYHRRQQEVLPAVGRETSNRITLPSGNFWEELPNLITNTTVSEDGVFTPTVGQTAQQSWEAANNQSSPGRYNIETYSQSAGQDVTPATDSGRASSAIRDAFPTLDESALARFRRRFAEIQNSYPLGGQPQPL